MLLILLLSLATSIHSLSAPECADGSISVCKCGDGNPPDFSTFPPCDIKKVSIKARVYFTHSTFALQGRPKCECPGGGGLASKYLKPRPKRPCNPGRFNCLTLQLPFLLAQACLRWQNPSSQSPVLRRRQPHRRGETPDKMLFSDQNILILSQLLFTRLFAGWELSKMFLRLPRLSGWISTHVSGGRTDHWHRSHLCLTFYFAVSYKIPLVALLPRTEKAIVSKEVDNSWELLIKVSEFMRAEHFLSSSFKKTSHNKTAPQPNDSLVDFSVK